MRTRDMIIAFLVATSISVSHAQETPAKKQKSEAELQAEKQAKAEEEARQQAEAKAKEKFQKQKVEELASEVLASGSEQKAIEQLKLLLKKYKGTPTEPALLFRLAELYMTKSKSSRVFEMFAEESDDVLSKVPTASFNPKSVIGKEKLFILEAVKVYELIEQKYPAFEQMDLVIYNNGYAHMQADMNSGAELVFTRLLQNKKLRNSPMIPDALLALGELNFKANNFPKALAFFELIKKYPDSKVYPYGLYKSSWAQYNMGNPEEALLTMEQVVDIGHAVEAEGKDSRLDLRKEALNDMALFFSESKPSSMAIKYFKDQAKNINPAPYLEKLSKIYNKHGKVKDEEMILLGLVKAFPRNPRRPFFHRRLAETYDAQNRIKEAVINLVKFDRSCDAIMSTGEDYDDPEVLECKDLVDSFALRTAKNWLKIWKKQDSKKHGIAAEQGLRVHLKDQKASADNADARYAFADLLFALDKYAEASEEYEKVGATIADKDKAHDSRYAALVAFDKSANGDWNDAAEKRLKILAENYLQKHPQGKHYLDVSFKVGLLDYQKEKLELAEPRFYALGKRFPNDAKGKKAQDLYLDILNTKKDFVALQKGALEWKSLEKDSKRQASLQKIFEQAYFSHVQVVISEEKYQEAIALYRSFATDYPKSDMADEAQWNIVSLFLKQDDYPGAAQAYFEFYKKFPRHEKAVEGLIRSADLYEQMGMPDRALEVTTVLSQVDRKNVASWLLLSGDFYAASGKYYEAIEQYKGIFNNPRYASKKGLSDEASQAVDRVIFLSDSLGTQDKYLSTLREMSESEIPNIYSPAVASYAEGLKKRGDIAALSRWIQQNIRRGLLEQDLASVSYLSGTLKETDYLRMQVRDFSMDVLTKDIDAKSKALASVQKAYQAGAQGGDAYTTVNSLVGLAALYQGFVTSLNEIEGPDSFGEDEKNALKDELANIVFPFEEKAVETIDAALKLAKKSDLRDGSVGRIQKILDRLNMKNRKISSLDVVLPGPAFINDKSSKGAK